MKKILAQLLNNLQRLINADIVFLLRINQEKIEIINIAGDESFNESFIRNITSVNTKDIFNEILITLKTLEYKAILSEVIQTNNDNYLFVSATKKETEFDEYKEEIHNEIGKSVEYILKEFSLKSNNLLAKQENFHLLASVSDEIIFILDEQGIFTFINEKGINELKYPTEEIYKKHFFDIVNEENKSEIIQSFQKIITDQKEAKFRSSLFSNIGSENQYEVILVPQIDNGSLNSLLGIAKNISRQDKSIAVTLDLEAKLTEAYRINTIEKDRAQQQISVLNELNNLKNEFISNVSHELRTPLASIVGFAETIAEDKNLTHESMSEFNDVILAESKRLAKLINDVLDFSDLESKKQELKLNSKNVIELVNNCLLVVRKKCKENGITLTEKVPDSEIVISIDEERLEKALNHLLANAIKFTKENGRITVIVQEFLKEVEIVVSDTGIGIPEEKIPLLFNKFSKANKIGNNLPGAGFGLVTVKQIIDLHKGLISVKSEVNKGTSFIIKLPKYSFN